MDYYSWRVPYTVVLHLAAVTWICKLKGRNFVCFYSFYFLFLLFSKSGQQILQYIISSVNPDLYFIIFISIAMAHNTEYLKKYLFTVSSIV